MNKKKVKQPDPVMAYKGYKIVFRLATWDFVVPGLGEKAGAQYGDERAVDSFAKACERVDRVESHKAKIAAKAVSLKVLNTENKSLTVRGVHAGNADLLFSKEDKERRRTGYGHSDHLYPETALVRMVIARLDDMEVQRSGLQALLFKFELPTAHLASAVREGRHAEAVDYLLREYEKRFKLAIKMCDDPKAIHLLIEDVLRKSLTDRPKPRIRV